MPKFTGPRTGNHRECPNCGSLGVEHDKKRVFPDDGPTGSWHYEYRCPDSSGRFKTPSVEG